MFVSKQGRHASTSNTANRDRQAFFTPANPPLIQPKLTIGQPGDRHEQEADRVAEQVMKTPAHESQPPSSAGGHPSAQAANPPLRRQPENEAEEEEEANALPGADTLIQPQAEDGQEEEEEETLQTKSRTGRPVPAIDGSTRQNIQSLRTGGMALPNQTRHFFESRMAQDFSAVRIHTSPKATQTARSLQARAFTLGHNIVFNANQYAPHSNAGKTLLAHELTHVIQQQGQKTPQIQSAPQPVTTFYEEEVPFTRKDIEKTLKGVKVAKRTARFGYWEALIATYYKYNLTSAMSSRFKQNPEERDAVLAALWQNRPTRIRGRIVKRVAIPARGTNTKPLLYDFTYTQKAKGAKKHPVSIQFISEGAKANIITAPIPPANFKPSKDYSAAEGFPGGIYKYWKKHKDEHKQVYYWIDKKARNKFDQKLITSVTVKGRTRRVLFRVSGTKTKHNIKFIGTNIPITTRPAAGYHSKTAVDYLLRTTRKQKGIKLGKITGLNKVPKDEKESVKYTIYQYFKSKARDTEVNAIVPIAKTRKTVFYTLRFLKKHRKTNTVDVEIIRVGVQKAGGKMDLNQLSVRRVHGFNQKSKTVSDLKQWLKNRYGSSISPTGTKISDIIKNADTQLRNKVNTDKWFKDNYNITILNPVDAKNRLIQLHNYVPAQTVYMKLFHKPDRLALEFALQTMSQAIINLIKSRSVHIARQKELYKVKGGRVVKDDAPGVTLESKQTIRRRRRRTQTRIYTTIIISDEGVNNAKGLFWGGPQGVRTSSVGLFAHEFGHVIEKQKKIKRKFYIFVKKRGIKRPTSYARKKPKTEFFTEAFMLYQTNPAWMQRNINILYKWFETLSKTGKPP